MKYIDNLLDWGDSLFAQFTMESVNEATMLYVMARDILGPRPAELGACGEGAGSHVRGHRRGAVSDFLVELEHHRRSRRRANATSGALSCPSPWRSRCSASRPSTRSR